MELAGIDFGSETMFMPYFTRATAGVQPGRAPSVGLRRQMAVLCEVAEPRELALELQFNRSRRSMALLGDNDFSLAKSEIHFHPPFFMLRRAHLGFFVLQIIFLAVDEQHDVGVLLDRTGFAQVRQLRMLVVAAFDLTRQLRKCDHWNIGLLPKPLQVGGDLVDSST